MSRKYQMHWAITNGRVLIYAHPCGGTSSPEAKETTKRAWMRIAGHKWKYWEKLGYACRKIKWTFIESKP